MADQKTKAEGFVKISGLLDGLVAEAAQAYSLRHGNDPVPERHLLNNQKQTDRKPAKQTKEGGSKPTTAQAPTELNCVQRSLSKGKSNA